MWIGTVRIVVVNIAHTTRVAGGTEEEKKNVCYIKTKSEAASFHVCPSRFHENSSAYWFLVRHLHVPGPPRVFFLVPHVSLFFAYMSWSLAKPSTLRCLLFCGSFLLSSLLRIVIGGNLLVFVPSPPSSHTRRPTTIFRHRL